MPQQNGEKHKRTNGPYHARTDKVVHVNIHTYTLTHACTHTQQSNERINGIFITVWPQASNPITGCLPLAFRWSVSCPRTVRSVKPDKQQFLVVLTPLPVPPRKCTQPCHLLYCITSTWIYRTWCKSSENIGRPTTQASSKILNEFAST